VTVNVTTLQYTSLPDDDKVLFLSGNGDILADTRCQKVAGSNPVRTASRRNSQLECCGFFCTLAASIPAAAAAGTKATHMATSNAHTPPKSGSVRGASERMRSKTAP